MYLERDANLPNTKFKVSVLWLWKRKDTEYKLMFVSFLKFIN